MGNIRKKVINKWDGGIKTSSRSNNPDTSDGAQLVKGFDVFKDPKKLIPMQSWEAFTTEAEKRYNIRAMGGVSETVYGVGSAMGNWYAPEWAYRLKITANQRMFQGAAVPLYLDMSTLPNDFWANAKADMSDVRTTNKDGRTFGVYTENVNTVAKTGDMWIHPNIVTRNNTPTLSQTHSVSENTSLATMDNASVFAYFFSVDLDGSPVNYFRFDNSFITPTTGASMGTLTVSLYTNNAGVPGTLVQTLGTYNADYITQSTLADYRDFIFNSFSLTGTYHIVLSCSGASAANIFAVRYLNSGTHTVGYATNVGLTAWSNTDTSSSMSYSFGYVMPEDIYFYIYYGNPDATELSLGVVDSAEYTEVANEPFWYNSGRFAYTFGDGMPGNIAYGGNHAAAPTGGAEQMTEEPHLYTTGLKGSAIKTFNNPIHTYFDDDVSLNSNDFTICLMVKGLTGSISNVIAGNNGTWHISVSSGVPEFFVSGDNANPTEVANITMVADRWYLIDFTFNNYIHYMINGLEVIDTTAAGDHDYVLAQDGVNIAGLGNNGVIAHLWGFKNDVVYDKQSKTKLFNFTESTFWTIGAQQDQDDEAIQFTGVQLYKKNIESGDWETVLNSGRAVRRLDYFPMNAFVDDSGTYFMVLSTDNFVNGGGSLYVAKVDSEEIIDPLNLPLGILVTAPRVAIQPETAIDATMYFNGDYSNVTTVSDASVFTAPSGIESLAAWRTYLAVAYTYRNKGYVYIWNLVADTLATEKVLVGTGRCRIVGTASDALFAVVDNYIDSAVRSASKPTMEIRQYVGNGRMETTHVIEVPVNIPTTEYLDYWDLAVSNFKIFRNQQTMFYARLPIDESGETFNEGLWAVGKNVEGKLALTLQIDTAGLGMPENIFGFAQQVFFIAKDGGIHRLADETYNNTALYRTLKMNEGLTETEKKLHGVELVFEPLDAGQTVSLYYKTDADAVRKKIFDLTETGAISWEQNYDINEENLPHYKEIEFEIESTGGKAAILEFNYKFEYLNDVT